MSAVQPAARCPFCQAELPRKATVCPSCHAHKQTRAGMSPTRFRAFALIWLTVSTVLGAAALYLALLPWLPERQAPPYALRLVGAAPVQPARCTVEVVAGAGAPAAASQAVVPCVRTDAPPQAHAGATRRRIAAVVHGVLVLSLAGGLSWLLRRGLRPIFMRNTGGGWVRRASS